MFELLAPAACAPRGEDLVKRVFRRIEPVRNDLRRAILFLEGHCVCGFSFIPVVMGGSKANFTRAERHRESAPPAPR